MLYLYLVFAVCTQITAPPPPLFLHPSLPLCFELNQYHSTSMSGGCKFWHYWDPMSATTIVQHRIKICFKPKPIHCIAFAIMIGLGNQSIFPPTRRNIVWILIIIRILPQLSPPLNLSPHNSELYSYQCSLYCWEIVSCWEEDSSTNRGSDESLNIYQVLWRIQVKQLIFSNVNKSIKKLFNVYVNSA